MNTDLVHAYTRIRAMIDEASKNLKALRDEERRVMTDISYVLANESNALGVRIDETRMLRLTDTEKKIMLKPKDYRQNIARVLTDLGLPYVDDAMIDSVVDARVGNKIQHKRLRIVKSRAQK